MKFFIDTGDVAEIQAAIEVGILDGVTTNPSLVAKSGKDRNTLIKEICALVSGGPVSAEVISTNTTGMIEEGLELAKIAPNVAVKLPLTENGLKACKALSDQDIMVNVTLCFSATQALMAAKAGAAFISPFVGRLDDIGAEGMQLIADIREIYDNYCFDTEIIVASVRSPNHVKDSALIGADIVTIPYKVFGQLIKHPLTDNGLAAFLADHQKSQA